MRINPFAHFLLRRHLTGCTFEVSTDSDGAYGITPLELGMMPVGFDRCHLPQRHPHSRNGGRHLERTQLFGTHLVSAGRIEHNRHTVRTLVERCDGRSLGGLTQIDREHGFGDTESGCLVRFEYDTRRSRHVMVVAMHTSQFGLTLHVMQDTVSIGHHLVPVVPLDSHLKRVIGGLVVELFEPRIRIREIVIVSRAVLLEHIGGRLTRLRVNDQLCIVRRRCLRGIGGMETR